MRTLSGALLAAQKAPSQRPHVVVEVLDRFAGVARPTMQRLYTGSEPDAPHHARLAGDGSLVRARVDPSTGDLYVQRVPSPGPGSNFGAWTLLTGTSTAAGLALAARGNTVRLFFRDAAFADAINQRVSTDSGQTWGPTQRVIGLGSESVLYLAAAISPSGVATLFYSTDEHVVNVMQDSGSGWTTPTPWPHSVSAVKGMDCSYGGDWNLAVAGEATDGSRKVWTCIYGAGTLQAAGTWSSLWEVTTAAGDSQVSFQWPFLAAPDVHRLYFVEAYGGAFSYNRPTWSHLQASATFATDLWREPVPFDHSCQYGLALAGDSATLWLSVPNGVWKGSLTVSTLDLTADVLELEMQEGPLGGSAAVVLHNQGGKYNAPGAGSLAALRKESELRVSPGYTTTVGPETVTGPSFALQGWEHRTGRGVSQFTLACSSPWGLLEHWRARRQYTWSAGQASVVGILRFLLARAGLGLDATGASTVSSGLQPAFTVYPDETGQGAAERLLSQVPDVLLFRGMTAVMKYPQPSDPSDYAYGTGHAILSGRYESLALEANRAQVYGQAGMAEAINWSEVNAVHDRLRQVRDLNLDTQQKVQDRAATTLRQETLALAAGSVDVPVNCGQELHDVVTVTDATAGLSVAPYRVRGIHWRYQRGGRGLYQQGLRLDPP